MDLGLRGKSAVVAAASKGLGRGVALALAREGAQVVMFARGRDAVEAAAGEIGRAVGAPARIVPVAADAASPADLARVVRTAADRFGGVHILYNNAGGPRPGYFDDLADEDWQQAFELNLLSAVRLTRLCLPFMRRDRWGRIITGTSISVKQPIAGLMLSNSIRSGTTAWSKTLANQVAGDGITVNCLAPGRIDTDRVRQLDQFTAERTGQAVAEARRQSEAAIPVGRYGTPEEFGAAAAFLASEQAAFITGTTLLVDGGQFAGTY